MCGPTSPTGQWPVFARQPRISLDILPTSHWTGLGNFHKSRQYYSTYASNPLQLSSELQESILTWVVGNVPNKTHVSASTGKACRYALKLAHRHMALIPGILSGRFALLPRHARLTKAGSCRRLNQAWTLGRGVVLATPPRFSSTPGGVALHFRGRCHFRGWSGVSRKFLASRGFGPSVWGSLGWWSISGE